MQVSEQSPQVIAFDDIRVEPDAHRLSRAGVDVPLKAGKLQIQSEAAECEYRRMAIRPLSAWPADVAKDLPSR